MRHLLYFPIIHSHADCGSLKQEMSKQGEQKYGKEKWKRHIMYVERAWGSIENFISQYMQENSVKHGDIRIYQDGLPAAGELGVRIVREIARQGSRNYQILERLVGSGACLEQAESRELLLQEYQHISKILESPTPNEKLKAAILYKEAAQELLEKRDRHIAERINATLKQDELGLAFFGAAHSITGWLDADIGTAIVQRFNDRISKEIISAAKMA